MSILYDENYNALRIDEVTKALPSIPFREWLTHQGRLFVTSVMDTSVPNNGTLDLLVRVPAGVKAHAVFGIQCVGNTIVSLFEVAITASPVGDPIAALNRDLSKDTSALSTTFFENPVLSSPIGTLIGRPQLLFGGEKNQAFAVESSMASEIILDEATDYIVSAENISGSATLIEIDVSLYEENTP